MDRTIHGRDPADINLNGLDDQSENLLISHLTLRKNLGILGILLPILVLVLAGENRWQSSISDYYYTNSRNAFVGILVAMGVFLYAYKGRVDQPMKDSDDTFRENLGGMKQLLTYLKRVILKDNVLTSLAGLSAVGIALFPTTEEYTIIGTIHFVSAFLFFLLMGIISFYSFTKEEHLLNLAYRTYPEQYRKDRLPAPDSNIDPRVNSGLDSVEQQLSRLEQAREGRIRIYRRAGLSIFILLLLMAIYLRLPTEWKQFSEDACGPCKPFFWLEALAIWAFSASWLIKGIELRDDILHRPSLLRSRTLGRLLSIRSSKSMPRK